MDIDYRKVTRIQNPLLIGQQKPLDIRTYVNSLSETDTIQNPYIGLMFYCNADGEYYKVTELKGGYYYLNDKFVYPSKKNEADVEYTDYISYDNALVKSYIKLVHGGSGSSGGGGSIPDPGPDPEPIIPVDPTTEYTITYNLTNVTISNTSKKISQGYSYRATVTPKNNYTLDLVEIKMDGTVVTDKYYSNGSIYIPSVTGNLVITATAGSGEGGGTAPTTSYRVNYYLLNFTADNNSATVEKDSRFEVTLTMTGDTNPVINVTMNGQKINYTVQGKDYIISTIVTGNINIMATSQMGSDYQPPEGEPDNYPDIWEDEETNDDYIWNYTIPNPNGIKYRELIGYLAACVCCNAFYGNTRENGQPFIKFKPLYQSRTFGTLKSKYYKEFKRERSSFKVKQVIVDTGLANYYTAETGATDDEKVLVNIPFGTQDIADYIGAKLIGLEPWGYNLKFIGNPQYEYGDKFNVVDLEGNTFTMICYTSKVTYNGGLSHDMSGVKLKPGNITNSYLEEKIKNDLEVTQDDITNRIEELNKVAEDLKNNEDNNKNTIGSIAGSVTGVRSDVKNLKDTVYNNHDGRIDELETDVSGLKKDIKDIKDDISSISGLSGLEERIVALETAINGLSGLEERIDGLEARITALEESSNSQPDNPSPEDPSN